MHPARSILFVQYTNPAGYPPLRHAALILANRGWTVLFAGIQALGTGALAIDPHPRIGVRLMGRVKPGWRQKLHYLAFTAWTMMAALRRRPHWIYASDALGCLPALLAATVCGARLAYHEHDFPAPERGSMFWKVVKLARRTAARRAEIVVLPNEQRLAFFAREVPERGASALCAWNCPSREESVESAPGEDDGRFWMYYHGSVNRDRLPLAVVQSLALLPEHVGLRIVGYETLGSQGYLQRLASEASALRIAPERLQVHGLGRDRAAMLQAARASHLGLALMPLSSEDLNLKHMVGASNKAFEYLACAIPVMVSDLPDWVATFVEPGYGIACNPDEAGSIARGVARMLESPGARRQMGQRGRERILADWNYETQFAAVLAALERDAGHA